MLSSDQAWLSLENLLGGGKFVAVVSIIMHLKDLGVKSYIVEDKYIDRDYSADYTHFYSRTFQSHAQHCKRVHFFSDDAKQFHQGKWSTAVLDHLRKLTEHSYCGFCVLRPLPNAPIGRTVLKGRFGNNTNTKQMQPTLTCRANYNANLLGIDLHVQGAPYLQQDSRVGACAQAAIWVGMRHLHTRYDYNWNSVADITRMALPIMRNEAGSLPAGSDFLTDESMIYAIRQAGYQPLILNEVSNGLEQVILPYVESGIPVILVLNAGQDVSHAVTVVGKVFAEQTKPGNLTSDYISAFIVQNDQTGPYKWLPMNTNFSNQFSFTDTTNKWYFQDHAIFAIALISPRVFSTAIKAESAVSSILDRWIYSLA